MKPSYSAAGSTRTARQPSTCKRQRRAPAARGRSRSRQAASGAAGAQRVALRAARGPRGRRTRRAAACCASRARRARRRRRRGTGRRGCARQRAALRQAEAAAPGRRAPACAHQGSSGASSSRRGAVGAGQREGAVLGEAHLERKHRHLDGGGVFVVAEQQVAGSERQRVHRAGGADAPAQRARSGPGPARWRARWPTGSRSSDHLLDAEADAVARLQQRRRIARRIEEAHRRCCRSCSSRSGPSEAETPVCAPPIDTAPPGMLSTGTLRRGVAMRGSMPPR